MTTKSIPTPAKPQDDDATDDWGVPPGKAEDVRDQGVLESLGSAVSETVKGVVPPDAAADELVRRQSGGA